MKQRTTRRVNWRLIRAAAVFGASLVLAFSGDWEFAVIGFFVSVAMLASVLPRRVGEGSGRFYRLLPSLSRAQRIAVGVGLLLVLGIPLALIQERRPATVAISIIVVSGSVAWLLYMIHNEGWKGDKRRSG
jgi:hypothetical protein